MAHLHYCLECNTVIGEGDEGCEADRDHQLDVCQTCAQHLEAGTEPAEESPAGEGASEEGALS